MSSLDAVIIGGLANNSSFFGVAQAETVSNAFADTIGSWNSENALSTNATWPFGGYSGAYAYDTNSASVFAFRPFHGGTYGSTTHRTILLGY